MSDEKTQVVVVGAGMLKPRIAEMVSRLDKSAVAHESSKEFVLQVDTSFHDEILTMGIECEKEPNHAYYRKFEKRKTKR